MICLIFCYQHDKYKLIAEFNCKIIKRFFFWLECGVFVVKLNEYNLLSIHTKLLFFCVWFGWSSMIWADVQSYKLKGNRQICTSCDTLTICVVCCGSAHFINKREIKWWGTLAWPHHFTNRRDLDHLNKFNLATFVLSLKYLHIFKF